MHSSGMPVLAAREAKARGTSVHGESCVPSTLGVVNGGGWDGGAGASEVVGGDGGAGDSHTVRGRKTSRWSCQPKRAGARGDMPGGRLDQVSNGG